MPKKQKSKQKESEDPPRDGGSDEEQEQEQEQKSTMDEMKLADAAVKLLRDRTAELFSEAGKSPAAAGKATLSTDAALVLTVRQVRKTVGTDGAAYLALRALLPREVAWAAFDVADERNGDRMKAFLEALDYERRQASAAAWAVRALNHTRQGPAESSNAFASRLEAAQKLATSLGAKTTEISGRRVLENARRELKNRVLDDKFLVATAAVELNEGDDELKALRQAVLRGELVDDEAFVDAVGYREAMALLRAAEALGGGLERDLPGAAMAAAVAHPPSELAAVREEVKRLAETVASLTKLVSVAQRGQPPRMKNCFVCGAPGHFAATCRNRQVAAPAAPAATTVVAAPATAQPTSGAAAVSIVPTPVEPAGKV